MIGSLRYAIGTTFSSINEGQIVQVLECNVCKSRFKCENGLDQFVTCPVCKARDDEALKVDEKELKEHAKELKRQRKKEFAAGLQE